MKGNEVWIVLAVVIISPHLKNAAFARFMSLACTAAFVALEAFK